MMEDVAESRYKDFGGSASIVIFVAEAFEGRIDGAAIILKGNIVSEQTMVVPESLWEASRFGIEQNEISIETGCIDKDDAGIIFGDRLCLRIHYADAGGLAFFLIVNNGLYNAERLEREFAGALGPGDGRGIGTEITAEGAAPFAEVPGLALATALFEVDWLGPGKVGAAADDHGPVFVAFPDLVADMLFDAVEFPGWKEFAVG